MLCLCPSHRYTFSTFHCECCERADCSPKRNPVLLFSYSRAAFLTQIPSMSYSSEKSTAQCFDIDSNKRTLLRRWRLCVRTFLAHLRLLSLLTQSNVCYIGSFSYYNPLLCHQCDIWPFKKKQTEFCRVPLRPSTPP